MANKTMLILRGNDAGAGNYPDEQGKIVAWPKGALHEKAARAFAKQLGYDDVVVDAPGKPQSQHSPQTKAALKAFHELDADTKVGLYGFSGGGYNVLHILAFMAEREPRSLQRIDRVVVIGSPNKQGGKAIYKAAVFNALVSRKAKGKDWKALNWEVIFRENPHPAQLPNGLPAHTPTHMFGPDVLLAGWPEDYKPPATPKPAHHASKKH